ncbi:ankyrin repeat-containing domain protein [Aspergillus bertholletiae]|uniref:Ankyrin repeat-containing domain protein n=1 Tax=Aspergillus bertholletiae TaxID=1226010 RepID=A0A5N7BBB8_9EURO|nr:ankyrin repeat-containing domain protein [Aspergillus bertholletiae]
MTSTQSKASGPDHDDKDHTLTPTTQAGETIEANELSKRRQTQRRKSGAELSRLPSHGLSIFSSRRKERDVTEKKGVSLYNAVVRGDSDLLRDLLDAGANLNGQAKGGQYGSALAAAAYTRNSRILRDLLDCGANANIQTKHLKYGSALVAAALSGSEDCVKLLLDRGVNVDMHVVHGEHGSALCAATFSGNSRLVRMLLEAGASPNTVLVYGMYGSALAAAISQGHEDVVSSLLLAGSDPDLRLQIGSFPTARAAAGLCGSNYISTMLGNLTEDASLESPFEHEYQCGVQENIHKSPMRDLVCA